MSSTPLICSSIGAATVSAMTLGLAPGYWACTSTDGGTTSGYSPVESFVRAMRPPRKITADNTAAKIGRSIKNLDMFMTVSSSGRCRGTRSGGHLHHRGLHDFVGLGALHAVDDDAFIGLQAGRDDAQAIVDAA